MIQTTTIAQAADPLTPEQLIEGLAQVLATWALEEGYVAAAIDGSWDPADYDLLPGDLEYLRGTQGGLDGVDLPLADRDAQAELESDVQARLRELLGEAVMVEAERRALDTTLARAAREQAVRIVHRDGDRDATDRLHTAAVAALHRLLEAESESLADGEALAWGDEHPLDADGDRRVLTDRDYVVARADGGLDWGYLRDQGIYLRDHEHAADAILDGWCLQLGRDVGTAEALTADHLGLGRLPIDPHA